MAKVVSCGWACLDQRYYVEQFPPTHSRTGVRAYREAVGGPAAVGAVAIARLGGEAHLVSRRGDDATGERLEALLRAERVKTHFQMGAATPVSAVLVAPDGERHIFPYRPELPEALVLNAERILEGADALLLDGRWPDGGLRLGQFAHRRSLPVLLDLDRDRPGDWSLVQVSTHVVASQEFAQSVGGVQALLERLSKERVWAAVTLGPEGVVYPGGHLPAYRVHVQDTTGAGDVFHGALALALAQGKGELEGLEFAAAAAALHCSNGAPPRGDEVRVFLGT
ncbi:MAG: carbohydrate kinase [Thermaceae bacterium]|nr:carbohydrate kinase [Thermaceae bacterium]